MSKVNRLIYITDIKSLQTRIVLFPNKEKLLKQVVIRLALFMSTN